MKKPVFQIQPQNTDRDQWTALSLREGLFFEPLEFCILPANQDISVYERLRSWYRASGRVASLHGAFIDVNPASGDPGFQALSRSRCHESCALAKELGAGQVVFHSSAFPFLRGAYLENWAAQCAEFYAGLSEAYHLTICIENSQDVDCEPLLNLMRRVGNTNVAVCLDVGHAHYSRAPMEAWFDQLGEYIRYMHLSDNQGLFDDHLPIGAGSVDWEQVNRLWEVLNHCSHITLEVGGISGVEQSIRFLRRQGYFGLKETDAHEY